MLAATSDRPIGVEIDFGKEDLPPVDAIANM